MRTCRLGYSNLVNSRCNGLLDTCAVSKIDATLCLLCRMELYFMENHFYPSNTDNSLWLSYYSQILDYVEIDSSFYSIPNHFMVKSWYKKTPEHFRFTAKFPKVITHDKRLN